MAVRPRAGPDPVGIAVGYLDLIDGAALGLDAGLGMIIDDVQAARGRGIGDDPERSIYRAGFRFHEDLLTMARRVGLHVHRVESDASTTAQDHDEDAE